MKRVIYSFYIDISKDEFVDNIKTNLNTKNKLKENYQRLIDCKIEYADNIGVPFKMFEGDGEWQAYYKYFKENRPYITTYNIVNFYKIHLLYKLAKKYDEILYLDFDVVPVTNESFFDVWDLSKGICVLENNDKVEKMNKITSTTQTIRSPTSKYYNTKAMLLEKGYLSDNNVINTGIIGANKEHIDRLKYFDKFEQTLEFMKKLKNNYDIFPKKIVDCFGYDNETIFSYKLIENKVPVQWLDMKWHYFLDTYLFVPKGTKLVHAINKRFDVVWRYIERQNYVES